MDDDLHPALASGLAERGDAGGRGAKLGGVVVGEEEDTHGSDGERERVERVYAGYRRDPRRRRAWSAQNAGNVAMREEVLRALLELVPEALAGEGLVLDAGCGTGWWLERLAGEGVVPSRLVGVDLLAKRVHAARERVPGARVVEGDVRRLPTSSGSCSLVLLFTVLSAMGTPEDVRSALGEARRVLARGGAIAVWEPRVPTPNPHTRTIGLGQLRPVLGGELRVRTLTLAPPLARRVGRFYGQLARIPLLRTHRLVVARP
jgi:SAM-dependent methyltransferase